MGGVRLPFCTSEVQFETDISDRSLSGIAPRSTKGDWLPPNCGLLNGIQNVAFVPRPSSDSSLIWPCMRSTS